MRVELAHLPEAAGDDMVLVGAVLLIVGPHMPAVLKCFVFSPHPSEFSWNIEEGSQNVLPKVKATRTKQIFIGATFKSLGKGVQINVKSMVFYQMKYRQL